MLSLHQKSNQFIVAIATIVDSTEIMDPSSAGSSQRCIPASGEKSPFSRQEDMRYHRVSTGVWQTLKRTLVIEEEEAEHRSFLEEDCETFHTPPQSPTKLLSGGDSRLADPVLSTSNASRRHYTPVRAERMLYHHDTIVRDLMHPEACRISAAGLDAPRGEGRRKMVMTYYPAKDGLPSRTVKYNLPREGSGEDALVVYHSASASCSTSMSSSKAE